MTLKSRINKLEESTGALGRGYLIFSYCPEKENVDEKKKQAMEAFIASGGKESDVKFTYAVNSYMYPSNEPLFKFVSIVC